MRKVYGRDRQSGRHIEKFFYEQEFNPIALYEIEPDIDNRGSGAIRYIDVNHAYEVVNKVKREDVVGKTFGEVWPYVEPAGRR